MDTLRQDLRYSLRGLLRTPGLTAIVLLSLGIGIGASTAVFTIVYELFLKKPPYAAPERVAIVWESNGAKGEARSLAAMANISDWSRHADAFEGIAAFSPVQPAWVRIGGSEAELGTQQLVTINLFDVMGVRPAMGRMFDPVTPGRTVVLSHSYWRQRFNGDPAVLGRVLTLPDGVNLTIVGVMPPGFYLWTRHADFWRGMRFPDEGNRDTRWLYAVGRLRPDVSVEVAQQQLANIARESERTYPKSNTGWSVKAEEYTEAFAAETKQRPMVYALFGAVGFTLLIACLNVANLLLTRALSRTRELAVRAALGAGRGRLIRQTVMDGVILTLPAGLLGMLVGAWTLTLFLALAPPEFTVLADFTLSTPVLVFTLMLSLLTCVGSALLPAIETSRVNLVAGLVNSGNRNISAPGSRTRRLFVVAEIGLSFVLVVAAGLMANGFRHLVQTDIGFDEKQVSASLIYLSGTEFSQWIPGTRSVRVKPPVARFYSTLLDRVRAIPGVESAGVASRLPGASLSTTFRGKFVMSEPREFRFTVIPSAPVAYSDQPMAKYTVVSGGFFESLRIPLLRGRCISDADVEDTSWVAVINEAAARRYWPGEDPIGRNIILDIGNDERPRRIVGITANVRPFGPFSEPRPEIYTGFGQQPDSSPADWHHFRIGMTVVVRGSNSDAIAGEVRKAVSDTDPRQSVFMSYSMEELLGMSMASWRFGSFLISAFSILSLLLAALGLYAVMSRSVSERIREIGIRVALGAEPTAVMAKVVREGMWLALSGVLVGIMASIPASRMLANNIQGIAAADPLFLFMSSGVLTGIALLALWIPARRAARLDPVKALLQI